MPAYVVAVTCVTGDFLDHFQFGMCCAPNHTVCAAASRYVFFNGKTLQGLLTQILLIISIYTESQMYIFRLP